MAHIAMRSANCSTIDPHPRSCRMPKILSAMRDPHDVRDSRIANYHRNRFPRWLAELRLKIPDCYYYLKGIYIVLTNKLCFI